MLNLVFCSTRKLFSASQSWVLLFVISSYALDLHAEITRCATNRIIVASADCQGLLADLTPEIQVQPTSVESAIQNPPAGTWLPLGTNRVDFVVTDKRKRTYTCSALVIVYSGSEPGFVPIANKQVECFLEWTFDTPVATNRCGILPVTILSTTTNSSGPNTFSATRIWQAEDEIGTSILATQRVAVVDTVPPRIASCPASRSLAVGSNCTLNLPDLRGELNASDPCDGPIVIVQSPPAGSPLGVGSYTIAFSVTDSAGNITNCSTTVIFNDTSFPLLTSTLTNLTLSAGPDCQAVLPDLTAQLTAIDCSPYAVTQSPMAGSLLSLGTNLVSLTATDTNGLSSSAALLVIVTDTTPPVFATLTNKTVECTAAWEFDLPEATDPCGTNSIVELSTSTNVLGAAYEVVRLWQATDAAGNSSTATQSVTLIDTTAPQVVSYPTNSILRAGTNCLAVLPDLAAQAVVADDCSPTTLITQSPTAGAELAIGTNTILLAIADLSSNSVSLSMTVIVVDNSGPQPAISLTNVALTAETDCAATVPELVFGLVAIDCNSWSVSQDPAPGAVVPIGTLPLTFTFADSLSNSTVISRSLVVRPPFHANTNVSISEFLAKNDTGLLDEDGTRSDWIEIRNAGPCAMNMDGWYLTDNADQLTKWRMPATNIPSGGYLVVWASDKKRAVPGRPLHTNFKLGDEGEYLALVMPDGLTKATEFTPTYPAQLPNFSYGMPPGGTTYDFMATATPGAANSGTTNPIIPELVFDPPRGLYTNPVTVSIQVNSALAIPGLKIYYTTNGSLPTPTNGLVYATPVLVSCTTVVRAAAYSPALLPGVPMAHTYLYPLQVPQQTGDGYPTNWGGFLAKYAMQPLIVNDPQWGPLIPNALRTLPTLSVSVDTEELFATNGIYANPFGDGDDWERFASVEYIPTDGKPGFFINCGLQLQGSLSRDPNETLKHNFRLYFRQSYGAARLAYEMYPGSPVTLFNTLVLRSGFGDGWDWMGARAQYIRDQWVSDTQHAAGGYGSHGQYVHLYLNGLYWGFYDALERPDANFASSYIGHQKSNYDVFNADELKDGTTNARNNMLTLARNGITNDAAYQLMGEYLDLPSFVDYMLINFYAVNLDWPNNNYFLVGALDVQEPFRFFPWDSEGTFSLAELQGNMTVIRDGVPGELYHSLRQWPEFRRLFADRTHRLLFNNGALTPALCESRWMRRADQLYDAIVAESARWGVNFRVNTRTDWLQEQNLLRTEWFPNRTAILLGHLRSAGLYPLLEAPGIQPHGGLIPEAVPLVVNLVAPVGVIYYTTNQTDPRLPDGTLSPDAMVYQQPLALSDPTKISARAFETNSWSALVQADYARSSQAVTRITEVTPSMDGSLHLTFQGFADVVYTISGSTNLVDWQTLTVRAPDVNGRFDYRDRSAGSAPYRFYRATWP